MIAVRLQLRKAEDPRGGAFREAGGAMLEIGPGGEVIGFDERASDLFGYSADEVLSGPVTTLIPDLKATAGGAATEPERHLSARRKDGTTITLDISVDAIRLNGTWVAASVVDDAQSELSETAARYQDATRIAKLGHWDYDEVADRITFVSEELARIHGITIQEYMDMVHSTDADIRRVHPEDREEFARVIRDAQENVSSYEVEYRIVLPDGNVRYIREIGEPVTDGDGRLIRSQGTIQDVTERRLREDALAESEAKFRHAERMADLIHWHTDAQDFLNWTYASDHAEELFGFSRDVLLGDFSNYTKVLHPADLARVEAQYRKNNEVREPYELEYRAVRPNREVRWFREVAEPIYDEARNFCGYRGTTQDVTYRKKIERDLENARIEAEASSRAKSEFLANMSHELRTPLNSIIGFSELMQAEIFGRLGDARYGGYVKDIEFSAQHLLSLITDILDISKIEAGSVDLEASVFSAAELIENCLSIIRPRAIRKHILIETSLAPDVPLLRADNRMLRQVMLNILSNAVKFTPEKGQVTIRAERPFDGGVAFVITDTGVGIARHDIPIVLEPFTQVGGGAEKANEGTGLGLALSKRMMEAHGGSLTIESEIGKGTQVQLILPPERGVQSESDPAVAAQAE